MMQTIINGNIFKERSSGKFTEEYIDSILDKISKNPKLGKRLSTVNNIYKFDLGLTQNKKSNYYLYYYFENRNEPVFIINMHKAHEKDILSKLITVLTKEAIGN